MNKTVNILGTEYTIQESTESKDATLQGKDGYCDTTVKLCVVEEMNERKPGMKLDLSMYKKAVTRHEIIHAFLYESGLEICSDWAQNEEMIDWIAIQFPKIQKVFVELGCDE